MSKQAQAVEQLTIKEIEQLTETSAKTLRAYLRRNFTRADEKKNDRWGDSKTHKLTKTQTSKLVERFSKSDESEEKQAS